MMNALTVEQMNAMVPGTLMESLGIEYTLAGPDFICGKMPVDGRTCQPAGLLHGGASVALAESLGSMGSLSLIDRRSQSILGIEVNANHIRPSLGGWVEGRADLVARSSRLHVWEIHIRNENNKLSCIARLTIMVADKNTTKYSERNGETGNAKEGNA